MRRNQAREDLLDAQKKKYLSEIDEIERKLKDWQFVPDMEPANLPEHIRTQQDVLKLINEGTAAVEIIEVDNLLELMTVKHEGMEQQLSNAENDVLLLDNEIKNKVIHKMDSEDIRYSVFRKVIAKEKAGIYAEAAGGYKAIVESLKDMKALGLNRASISGRNEYLPLSRVISSEFYQCKTKAKLYYETCFKKIMNLNRRIATPGALDDATLREFSLSGKEDLTFESVR